jgi:hypothetical protein
VHSGSSVLPALQYAALAVNIGKQQLVSERGRKQRKYLLQV